MNGLKRDKTGQNEAKEDKRYTYIKITYRVTQPKWTLKKHDYAKMNGIIEQLLKKC